MAASVGNLRPDAPSDTKLKVLIPPSILRPLAFRILTRKHNLTLSSTALERLAAFVSQTCGQSWRQLGSGEKVLDDVAQRWKQASNSLIIGSDLALLEKILNDSNLGLPLINTGSLDALKAGESNITKPVTNQAAKPNDYNIPGLETSSDILYSNLRIVNCQDQPRLRYSVTKKQFSQSINTVSLFPSADEKAEASAQRYHVALQRLLRNKIFQHTLVDRRAQRVNGEIEEKSSSYKFTEIANLLGRSGTCHLIFGILTLLPTKELALSDLSGNVILDVSRTTSVPQHSAWYAPGMFAIVDGIFDGDLGSGSALGQSQGVGGNIGGRFLASTISMPPAERREQTLGWPQASKKGEMAGVSTFGWVDFLGTGSEKGVGESMRTQEANLRNSLEASSSRKLLVCLGEVNLDHPETLRALRRVLEFYASKPEDDLPAVLLLVGNFASSATMTKTTNNGSREYKELFDNLALILSEFPHLLRVSKFILVPGDNDAWNSAFTVGAATSIPRNAIPSIFTTRLRRVISEARTNAGQGTARHEHIELLASNPCRISIFGPCHEIVVFRDDLLARLRRKRITLMNEISPGYPEGLHKSLDDGDPQASGDAEHSRSKAETISSNDSRRAIKTILDQGNLSPFSLSDRPILWNRSHSLQLYPLPNTLLLIDPTCSSFITTYNGCHVINPGALCPNHNRRTACWIEYDLIAKKGEICNMQV